MKQYLDLLQNILENGVEKESGRANMPNTIGVSKGEISMNLQEGFPLLTTKKMYWKGIIHELLWFLRGETNIKYLVDNNVNIWNGDAYRWYLATCNGMGAAKPDPVDNLMRVLPISYRTIKSFVDAIKNNTTTNIDERLFELYGYKLGDLGKVYGYQWRNQNGVDQVKDVLIGLKSNPYSRYHVINAWNKADFHEMALPPCHLMYQFIVRPLSLKERIKIYASYEGQTYDEFKLNWDSDEQWLSDLNDANIPKFYLDLNMYQRSVDSALGCPFNLASMSCLLKIFAKTCNMLEGVATWIGGDTHIYVNHIEAVKEQLKREPYKLPELKINKELNNLDDILALTIDDFELLNYVSHPKIDFELFSGLKNNRTII
jgi:thymidylate synthase